MSPRMLQDTAAQARQPLPLADLGPGATGTLEHIEAGCGLTRRLAALGLTPGVRLTVVAHFGGPSIVSVRGMRLALGHQMARRIWVVPDR
ncbi:MAG: ferrous iron transport protein A [Limnochordaceae bacterium]|nr:ferrous iron transport protein A [Limnochordaceae bacterium]